MKQRTPTGATILIVASSVLLASGCRSAKSPSASRANAICVANSTDCATEACVKNEAACVGTPSGSIERDVHGVCDTLRATGLRAFPIVDGESGGTPSDTGERFWPDLKTGWSQEVTLTPARVLYYEGHGSIPGRRPKQCTTSRSENLHLYSPDGEQEIPWQALLRGMPKRPANQGWTVLILNACESGFADVRDVSGPFTLIGSGYGLVPQSGPSVTFASALIRALGNAGTDLNCDGVLSDRELQQVVNVELKKQDATNQSNPIAVVRRQADADVPVIWTRVSGSDCSERPSLESLLRAERAKLLPCSLLDDLREQVKVLGGHRASLVESSVRYLFVADQRTCGDIPTTPDPSLLPLLVDRAAALGYHVVSLGRVNSEDETFVGDVGRLATFAELYLLKTTNGVVSLTSLRDSEVLISDEGDLGACEPVEARRRRDEQVVRRVLRCLPTRVGIVGSSLGAEDLGCREGTDARTDRAITDACTDTRGRQTCLPVRVDGRFPTSTVRQIRADQFLDNGSDRSAPAIDWKGATPISCHSALGQCFAVQNESSEPRIPGEWLLIEDSMERLTRQAKERACER